jgi:hypothetical protein
MGIRELAESDLAKTLEDQNGAGTPYILSDGTADYTVTGTFGDIAYLFNPGIGNTVQAGTITATYRIKTLRDQTEKIPERGWKVRAFDLAGKEQVLHVTRYEPDRTIGIARLTLAVKP